MKLIWAVLVGLSFSTGCKIPSAKMSEKLKDGINVGSCCSCCSLFFLLLLISLPTKTICQHGMEFHGQTSQANCVAIHACTVNTALQLRLERKLTAVGLWPFLLVLVAILSSSFHFPMVHALGVACMCLLWQAALLVQGSEQNIIKITHTCTLSATSRLI